MDCKYILENDIHEKYLLGNLPVEEKSEFEQHLAECAACRQEMEKQKFLISGLRFVGKREMKNEIRRQVKEIKTRKQPLDWQMILKVAAVVFIIALIPSAIYYFQTDSGKPLSPVIANKQALSEEDNFFADEQSAQQKQSPGKSGEVLESKELVEKSEQRQNAPMPAMPLAERSISESVFDSMAIGKSGAPAETVSIAATINESEMPEMLRAESHPKESMVEVDTSQINQDIAQGTKYYFAQLDKKKSRFDAEEREAPQMLDEVATQKFAPNAGRQARKLPREGTPITSGAVYIANGKKITIYFDSSKEEFRIDTDTQLPQSFNVQILNRDSLDWEMIWQVKPGFLDYDPSQMEIVTEDQAMYLIILKKYVYRIDLNSDSPKAVLVKK